MHYEFLLALESCAAVCAETGWQPHHGLVYLDGKLAALAPLYIKEHSYGEYVFDHAWAHAYDQHGLNYYPKLVNAIPFTPVSDARILVKPEVSLESLLPELCQQLQRQVRQLNCSSFHTLFVTENFSNTLNKHGFLPRKSVQFEWVNRGYSDFSDYLASFASRKRKNINKERQKIQHAGVTIERLNGKAITEHALQHFYHCYRQTYLKRSGHSGYLNWAFFQQIRQQLSEHMLLVFANLNGKPIASALFFYDHNQLSGRYWGALQDIDSLHFECCYYQGIEFCLEHKIPRFNPGTQGEHKILRGFEPVYCYSNHWLSDRRFHHGVAQFIQQENPHLTEYKKQAESLLPFKSNGQRAL